MWRMRFAVCVAVPAIAAGQSSAIPGRDLLAFPLGLTGEAAALGSEAGTGLWNPATALLDTSARWRLSAAAMNAPTDLGVSAQVGSIAGVWRHTTMALTVAYSAVTGLPRTDSDPLAVGSDIAYSTLVLSAIAARRLAPGLVAGVALRSRNGRLDDVNRTGVSLDVGLVAEHLTPLDARVGVSTFLLSPWSGGREQTTLLAAADLRILGADSARALRAGYAMQRTSDVSTEQYAFAAARWGVWEVRGGPVRTAIFGGTNWRGRLGIAVRHAGYAVGVSREESAGGLGPTYHFSLSATLQ
jgi:hypothetical protein